MNEPVTIGDATLYHADCMDVLSTLEGVDCVITDPPYGVQKAEWDNEFPVDWIKPTWEIVPRMLVMPGSHALIYAGSALGNYKECIVLQNLNGMTHSRISFGNWIPVLACGEWKKKPRPNVIPFTVEASEKIDHPSPKPMQAMNRLLGYYTEPEWCILDPFMGSGTTGVAALRLGRKFIGIEIDEKYFQIACERIQKEADQGKLFQ